MSRGTAQRKASPGVRKGVAGPELKSAHTAQEIAGSRGSWQEAWVEVDKRVGCYIHQQTRRFPKPMYKPSLP